MTPELTDFLSFYLPKNNLEPLLACFHKKRVSKHELLLRPGDNCSYLAFIQKGCFRVYYYDRNGKEVITWFSFTEMVITDLYGFYADAPAKFYVEAMEESILYKISKADLESLYSQHPEYLDFGRKFAEEAFAMLMDRTMSLHTKSAEERYRELLQIPEFMQKVPLKHLASFLGITDTSLSRIRKSIR